MTQDGPSNNLGIIFETTEIGESSHYSKILRWRRDPAGNGWQEVISIRFTGGTSTSLGWPRLRL